MKMSKWIFFALISSLTLSGCFIDINDDGGIDGCIRGEGPIISEELDLNRIDAIDLQLPAKVYIRQGPEQRVEVEAQGNIIDYLEHTVRGGYWEITIDERCVRNMEDMRIFLTLPEITALKISGSGEIISENTLKTDDLDLSIAGSGNISLDVEADDIDADISGSGNLRLGGLADEISFTVTGSGDLQAFDLMARKGDIHIDGSGDVEIYVSEELSVSITGSGDVLYKGGASLNVSVSGSGGVIDAN